MPARPTVKILKDSLSAARLRLYLTQRELADRAGVSDETIGRLERDGGRILAKRVPKFAAALKLTEQQFVAEIVDAGGSSRQVKIGPGMAADIDALARKWGASFDDAAAVILATGLHYASMPGFTSWKQPAADVGEVPAETSDEQPSSNPAVGGGFGRDVDRGFTTRRADRHAGRAAVPLHKLPGESSGTD